MGDDLPGELELEEGIDRELENILNHPAPAYGDVDYWNGRYRGQRGECFEWFQPWSALRPHVSKHLLSHGIALVVGCGSSAMSYELSQTFSRIVSIDISEEVVNQMKERYAQNGLLEWLTMDCTRMQFGNNTFDAIFDKGTLDTLMCYDSAAVLADQMVKEVARVLHPGGCFVVVSYGIPKTRKQFFDKANGFSLVDAIEVPKPGMATNHYVYVAKVD
jgi:ubiquinone/menaquinone biosynthesis C-methylase UbiE